MGNSKNNILIPMKEVSFELLHKYNIQGPRYTSYPPAPSWKGDIGPIDYEKKILESNNVSKPAPLSLYFHLPFCEKLCYFCGCHTLITGKKRSYETPYLKALKQEVAWLAARIDPSRPVVQLHLGGGTPTYSSPQDLADLMTLVKSKFNFSPEAEIGLEVDPRVTTKEHLRVLSEFGFNRLSMGVQDFDPQVQKGINRLQSYEQTKAVVDAGRELGYVSINMDLIFGLPYQKPKSFQETIEKILRLKPDRLAVYSYAHVPWLKKHQQMLEIHLPTEREKYEIFLTALRMFQESGFEYIGMDHFAKSDDELARARRDRSLWRNFMGYTTKAGTDLFGLGMSAISGFHGCFMQNQKETNTYEDSIKTGGAATLRGFVLSPDDKIRSRVISNLLCHAEVVKQEINEEFGIDFNSYFKEALEKLKTPADDGLLELLPESIRPTPLGRIFLRNLAMPFDAYLPKPGEKKVFSKTL